MSDPVIPITRPWMDEREADAARRVILSGWVTQGPEVRKFEEEFAAAVGAGDACAVSNCTTALHLALRSASVEPGDEVITASHSFIATANAIRYCGATPVFVDIEPNGCNIDPRKLEAAIGPGTKAILAVHQVGMPCDLQSILGIARRHALPVVEDAACAIGSEILWDGKWERIGKPHADIACFSFHPRKLVTTGDGGMLTARDPEVIRRFRLERQHAMSVADTVRHGSKQVVAEQYLTLGFNYRMTDIQAAVGRVQLARLPEIVERRRAVAARYFQLLKNSSIGLPREPEWARSNWQSFFVQLPESCDQLRVMQRMLDRGVASRRGVMCAHREPAYTIEPWRAAPGGLAESERAQDHQIILPLFHDMSEAQQDSVVATLVDAVERRAAA